MAVQDYPQLFLEQTIGFDGSIIEGYIKHPDGEHVIYAIGRNVVIQSPDGHTEFLREHTEKIASIAISRSGRYIASGEETRTSYPADIVIWDYDARRMLYKLHQHNGKVQGISFSPSEQFMVSLGGLDDNDVVVWNVAEGKPICGHRVALEYTNFIRFFNNSDESFVTGGKSNPRVWDIDYKNTKLISNEINQGHMRRIWTTAVIDNDDQYAYLGSTTGDIVAIDIQNYYLKHFGPVKDKDKLQAGISQLELFNLGDKGAAIVAGSGNGEIVLYKVNDPLKEKIPLLDTLGRTAVLGKITTLKIQPLGYGLATKTMKRSMSPKQTGSKKTAVPTRGPPRKVDINGRVVPIATAERSLIPRQKDAIRPSGPSWEQKGPLFDLTVATDQSMVYSIIVPTMDAELVRSSHRNGVRGVAFAQSTSEIFATCGYGDIRLWHLRSGNELVRIEVPNVECLCVCFNPSGTEVISGWSDGKIRSFGPESGRLLYVINDAHKKVTSITTFHNSPAIVSGGSEGQVRLWKLGRDSQQLVATMKEHRMAVTAVRVTQDDLECVSSGSDGQMLTWSLTRHIRLKQMIKTANFQGVDYLPDNSQFIACGSDRFATYFDAFEGKQLREVELSDKELFDIAVDPTGMKFALVGADQLVKLVDYDEGKITHLGRGHPDSITCVTWSPDGAHIVSGSADGSIFIWQAPR